MRTIPAFASSVIVERLLFFFLLTKATGVSRDEMEVVCTLVTKLHLLYSDQKNSFYCMSGNSNHEKKLVLHLSFL